MARVGPPESVRVCVDRLLGRGMSNLSAMDIPAARRLAQMVAWGRIGIGVTAVCAPTLVARPWIGPAASGSANRVLARTMGGRDLALGLGAVRALAASDREARPWVALGGMADAVDALATMMAFPSLPRRTRWGILAVTVGAAVVSIRVATALDETALDDPALDDPALDETALDETALDETALDETAAGPA